MCLHTPLEEGGDGEGDVQSTSCYVSRLPVRRHRGSNHADALYIAERESANVWRKRSSVPRSPALLAVRRAGQQTRPTATPSLDPYAQAASGSPGFVGKQDADLPVGGGLCWRGDTGMRGELDRGDRESVQRAPRILHARLCGGALSVCPSMGGGLCGGESWDSGWWRSQSDTRYWELHFSPSCARS